VKRARHLIQRDTSGKIESALNEIHAILMDYAKSVAADAERGALVAKWTAQAARETLAVLLATDPIECGLTVAGVFMLRAYRPHLFESDRGFMFQLVRQFRAQSDLAYGSYYDYQKGRPKKTYRDLPTRVVSNISVLVTEAYARFVGHLLRVDHADRGRKEQIRNHLDVGFASS
jgi:hypothetical protein